MVGVEVGAVDIEMTLPDLGDADVWVAIATTRTPASTEKPNFQHAVSAISACMSAIMLANQCVRKAGCTCIRRGRTPRALRSGRFVMDDLPLRMLEDCGRQPPLQR